MGRLIEKYAEFPKVIRRPLWRFLHFLISLLDKQTSTIFMNYGYASDNGEFKGCELKPEDLPDRYSIQLYHHVTRHFDFNKKEVLEVGSGRGGGASFISRYFKPKAYTGLDISKKTINFCNARHKVDGLNFVKGHAEKLPFNDSRFDAVVNVESARCYGNIRQFFEETYRVLRPGGKFLFADMIKPNDISFINRHLEETGFKLFKKENIRENVINALVLDTEYRKEHIHQKAPKFLHKLFYQFAGVQGSEMFDAFEKTRIDYWSYTLYK